MDSPLSPLNGSTPVGRRHRRIQNLQAALDSERFDKNYLQEELKRVSSKLQHFEKQNVDYKNEISSLKLELALFNSTNSCDETKEESKRRELENRLKREVEGVEGELLTAIGNVTELTQENCTLSKKVAEMEKEIANWQMQALELSQIRENLQVQIKKTREENAGLKESLAETLGLLEAHRVENKLNMSVECDDETTPRKIMSPFHSRTPIENLSKVVDIQLKEQIDQNKSLNDQLLDTQNEVSKLKSKLDICENIINSLKNDLEVKSKACKELSDENSRNVDTIASTQHELEQSKIDLQLLSDVKANLESDIVQFKETISVHQTKISDLDSEIHDQYKKIEDLEMEKVDLTNKCNAYDEQCRAFVLSLEEKDAIQKDLDAKLVLSNAELESCMNDYNELSNKNETLKLELQVCQENLDNRISEVLHLKETQKCLDDKLATLNSVVYEQNEKMDNYLSKINTLTDENQNLMSKCETYEKTINNKESEIKSQLGDIKSLEERSAIQCSQIENMTGKCQDYEMQCQKYQKTIDDHIVEISVCNEKVEMWMLKCEEKEKEISSLNNTLQNALNKHENDVDAYEKLVEKLTVDCKNITSECGGFKAKCDQLQTQCDVFEQMVKDYKIKIQDHQDKFSKMMKELSTFEHTTHVLEEKCQKYMTKCHDYEKILSECEETIVNHTEQIQKLTTKTKVMVEEKQNLKVKCQNHKDEAQKHLQNVTALEKEVEISNHNADVMNDKYETLEKKNREYKDTINNFKAEMKVCGGEIEALVEKLKATDEEYHKLKTVCQKYENEIETNRDAISKLEVDKTNYRNDVTKLLNEVESGKSDLLECKAKYLEYQELCQNKEERIEDLESRLKVGDENINRLIDDLKNVQSKHGQLEVEHKDATSNYELVLKKSHDKLEDATSKCSAMEMEIGTLNEKCQNYELDIQSYKKCISDHELNIQSLEANIQELLHKEKVVREKLDNLEAKCDDLETQNETLKTTIDGRDAVEKKLLHELSVHKDEIKVYKNDMICKSQEIDRLHIDLQQLNNELEKKIVEHTNSVQTFESLIQTLKGDVDEMSAKYQDADTENKTLKENILEVLQKEKSIREQNENLETMCKNLETQTLALKTEIEKKVTVEKELLQQLALCKEEIESCKEDIVGKTQEIDRIHSEIKQVNDELANKVIEHETSVQTHESCIHNLKRDVDEMNKKYEEVNAANETLKEKCREYEIKVEEYTSTVSEQQKGIEVNHKTVELLTTNIKTLEAEKNALETKYQADVEQYMKDLEASNTNIQTLTSQWKSMDSQYKELEVNFQEKVNEYERCLEINRSDISRLNEINDHLSKGNDETKARCEELEAQSQKYQEMVVKYEADVDLNKDTIAKLQDNCKMVEDEFIYLKEKSEEYKSEIDRVLQECHHEIEQCNDNIQVLTEKCQALELENDSYKTRCEKYETECVDYKQSVDNFARNAAKSEELLRQSIDKIENTQRNVVNLQLKCDELESQNESLKEQTLTSQTRAQSYQIEIAQLNEKLQLCTNEKITLDNNYREDINDLENKLASFRLQIDELTGKCQELDKEYKSLDETHKETINKYEDRINAAVKNIETLEDEKRILDVKYKEMLQNECDTYSAEIGKLTLKCEELAKEKENSLVKLEETAMKHADEIKLFNEEVEVLKCKERECFESVEKLEEKARNYVQEISELSEHVKHLKCQNEELKTSNFTMKKTTDEINEQLDKKSSELHFYREKLSNALSDVSKLKSEVEENVSTICKKNVEIESLSSNCHEVELKYKNIYEELEVVKEEKKKAELAGNDEITSTTKTPTRISSQFEDFVNKYHDNEGRIKHSINIYEDQCKKINQLKTFLYRTNINLTSLLNDDKALNKVVKNKKIVEEALIQLENANADLSNKILNLITKLFVEVSYNMTLLSAPENTPSGDNEAFHKDESFIHIIDDIENVTKITKVDYDAFQMSLESTVDKNSTTVYQEIQELVEKCKILNNDVAVSEKNNQILTENVQMLQSRYDAATKEKLDTAEKLCALQRVLQEMKIKHNDDVVEQKKLAHENLTLKRQYELLKCDMDNMSLKLNLEIDGMKKAYERLSLEYEKAQCKFANGDENKDQIMTDMKNEYEEKLGRMKQKMKQLYHDEMTRLTEKHKEETDSVCKKYLNRIKQYEEHVNQLMSEQWKIGEKLLIEKKENEELKKRLREYRGSQQSLNSITSTVSLPHTKNEMMRNSRQGNVVVSETSRRKLPSPIKENIPTFKQPSMRKVESGGLYMSDEEGEVFDNTYLSDLKAGVCEVRNVGSLSMAPLSNNKGRLSELQWRNSLCPPHLKSSYPAETQFHNRIKEEEIKSGAPFLVDDSPPLEKNIRNKKEPGQTAYHKPGPPTPSKNTGRLSLQGNESREVLREWNDVNPKRNTPSRIKAFFSSNTSKADENTFGTPKSRRLSSIFRKPR